MHTHIHMHVHTHMHTFAHAYRQWHLCYDLSVLLCASVSRSLSCIYVCMLFPLQTSIPLLSLFHLYAHQPYFPPINLPPSIMLLICHCRCGSDGCVWNAPADSSELCLPGGPCHRRCKQTKDYLLSVSSTLKVNQPSIAPLYADKVSMTTFYMMRSAESCNFV